MAAATAKNTIRAVARPMEVRTPSPVMARAAVATTTVPPAKTTAAPDDPMASPEPGRLSLTLGAVLPVAGHDEQRVVDPTPRPTRPATGMAEADTSIVPAIRVMPPMPAPTATIARPMGTSAATSVPNTTSRTRSATRSPIAV